MDEVIRRSVRHSCATRVLIVAGALCGGLSPSVVLDARAQDQAVPQPPPLVTSLIAATTFDSVLGTTRITEPAKTADAAVPERPVLQQRSAESHRSALLASLYATTVMWQALDVHSTFQVLDRGGVERNPVLSGFAQNRGALIAAKAAIAASSLYAASRIGRHNRMAAIAALICIDTAYALVVSHNYAVARGSR